MKKLKRTTVCLLLLILMISLCAVTVLAEGETTPPAGGDFVGVITKTWERIKTGGKTVCTEVVFPALTFGLAIWFVIACSTCYSAYKKSNTISITGPIILFICLLIVATAPLYLWEAIGW